MSKEDSDSANVMWSDVLEEAKGVASNSNEDSASTSLVELLQPLLQPCFYQLSAYGNEMSAPKEVSALTSTALKDLVVQTRAALRFGLFCVAPNQIKENSNNDSVAEIQCLAVESGKWFKPLVAIQCHKRGDSKCRLLAARLLCNVVTANATTASRLSTSIPLSPTSEYVTQSIQKALLMDHEGDEEDRHHHDDVATMMQPNWVDMILTASKCKQRDALAAIVATSHNVMAALVGDQHSSSSSFAENVASNGMLLNALLRNFVSAEDVVASIQKSVQNEETTKSETVLADNDNHSWDSATEWIQLVLAKLTQLGWLPSMYSAIGCGNTTTNVVVVPEQNVLLHCMAREADAFVMEFSSNKKIANPFGGAGGIDKTLHSYGFLGDLASLLSCSVRHGSSSPTGESTIVDVAFDDLLVQAGYITVLDILRSTLGVDNDDTSKIRGHLGERTALLQESAKSLGVLTDTLAERSVGKRARDVRLSTIEQQLLTNLVCLIGNMCYRCKQNQDLLRTTLVPQKENGNAVDSETKDAVARNGLHVLLSCTTFATSCFTLREWGVIAIRNALEDNTENQSVVADLVAQDPVQSADLENAGIRVKMDSKGKVTLSKIDAKKDKIVEETEDDLERSSTAVGIQDSEVTVESLLDQLPNSMWQTAVTDLQEKGVAVLDIPREDSVFLRLEPFHQRAFDTARSAMEQVQNKYVEPIIIPPDADSAHVTGFHTAGGMSSRYNAHREGFVFSDQGCIDGKVLQETGDDDNFVGQFHQAQWMMFQSLQGIANHILQNMESAMELPKGWFQQNLGPTDTSSQWHMKRYIQQQHQETEDGSSAQTTESGRRILLPMHTDPSLISVVIHDWSLLPAHDAGTNLMGLQVLETQDSNWKDLQRNTSNKNCVLATVFVGSVLAHITERTWPAAKHRVVDASSSSAAARMAATLFVRPQSSAVLPTPLPSPKLSKSTLKSKQPVTFGKWLQRVAKNYESKKQNTDPNVLLSDAKDNDKNQDLDSKTISSCHVCGADCHTRCTLCKYVYYCSVRCQRIDWNEGSHRTTCSGRKKPKKSTKQTEKLPILGPLPAKLRNDDDVQHALDELVSLTNWSGDKQRDKEKRNGRQSTSEAIPDQPKSNCTKEESEMFLQNAPSYSLIAGIAHLDDSVVSYMVEDMPQISCYKLALKRQISTQSPDSSLNLKISVEQKASAVHSNRTLILVQADGMKADTPLFVGEFPHPLEKDGIRLQTEKEREPDSLLDVYHISLPYPQELASSSVLQGPCNISGGAMQLTSLQDINGVACGRCSSTLFSCVLENGQDRPQKSVIEKVLPMPQGRWDDVAEYLICYSGQPTVDFTSAAVVAQPGVALEDANLLCLHPADVGESVCVSANPNYGLSSANDEDDSTAAEKTSVPKIDTAGIDKLSSAEGRGDRLWESASGGDSVTLSCSQCSSKLGFASLTSPETWRLWKHRLKTKQPLRSCASFLVGEMVGYAESKAIFTFVVGKEDEDRDRCLLLHLLSWETSMAWSDSLVNQQKPRDYRLNFRKVAKVVFEESSFPNAKQRETQWMWGGVDLCGLPDDLFLPSKTPKTSIRKWPKIYTDSKASTVFLDLPSDEYTQVLDDLQRSRSIFSKSYEEATILIKMGQTRESLGLAVIPLQ